MIVADDPPPKQVKKAKLDHDLPPKQETNKSRTNWGKGEAKLKLEKAVEEWDEKGKGTFDSNGEPLHLKAL